MLVVCQGRFSEFSTLVAGEQGGGKLSRSKYRKSEFCLVTHVHDCSTGTSFVGIGDGTLIANITPESSNLKAPFLF